jgi:type IV pilus assembly protein PilO
MAINLSLSKLPWYGQVGAIAALAIAGGVVFWNYYAKPAQIDIEQRLAQLQTIRAEVIRGQRTARELPEFRKRIGGLEAQLVDLSRQLPEEQDVADLLRRVQGMATESSLTIRGFTPQTVASKQLHIEWPIGLKLEGRYHDLGAFLERVSKFPRIINVGDIKIKAVEKGTGGATVTADCTATTFVMKDAVKPAGAALPPGVPSAPGASASPAAKAAR